MTVPVANVFPPSSTSILPRLTGDHFIGLGKHFLFAAGTTLNSVRRGRCRGAVGRKASYSELLVACSYCMAAVERGDIQKPSPHHFLAASHHISELSHGWIPVSRPQSRFPVSAHLGSGRRISDLQSNPNPMVLCLPH